VALAALRAGAGVAKAAGFSQINLASNIRARNGDRLEPDEPLGCLVRKQESHLDFGPNTQTGRFFW
jgi:hypothetical protein